SLLAPFTAALVGATFAQARAGGQAARIVGGVALGAGAAVLYGLALADVDDAGHAATYDAYRDLVERGHDRRLAAGILAGAGVALTAAGVYRLWHHPRRAADVDVALAPRPGGGVVAWTGRF
ncbi:MAG TPA: hypothetical protein VHE35_29635, partial [Kofleriaceae bacterium]|nr:hypothetical protein [Kofleriaceae bacterium]